MGNNSTPPLCGQQNGFVSLIANEHGQSRFVDSAITIFLAGLPLLGMVVFFEWQDLSSIQPRTRAWLVDAGVFLLFAVGIGGAIVYPPATAKYFTPELQRVRNGLAFAALCAPMLLMILLGPVFGLAQCLMLLIATLVVHWALVYLARAHPAGVARVALVAGILPAAAWAILLLYAAFR
jgi:hypothetical protein